MKIKAPLLAAGAVALASCGSLKKDLNFQGDNLDTNDEPTCVAEVIHSEDNPSCVAEIKDVGEKVGVALQDVCPADLPNAQKEFIADQPL